MAKVAKKRVQVLMSKEMGDQVEALAVRLGVSESAAGAVLIAAGLSRFAEVLEDPVVLRAAAAQVRAEVERERQGQGAASGEQLGFGRSRGKAQLGGSYGYIVGLGVGSM